MLIKGFYLFVSAEIVRMSFERAPLKMTGLSENVSPRLFSLLRHLQLCKFIRVLQENKRKDCPAIMCSAVELLPIFIYYANRT